MAESSKRDDMRNCWKTMGCTAAYTVIRKTVQVSIRGLGKRS
jgi:hypothetical protein